LTITDVSGGLPIIGGFISATATLDLGILPDTENDTITGSFDTFVEVSLDSSMINLRLGDQLDDDILTVSQGGQVLQLGCFEILNRIPLGFVAPLGVANLAGKIYTINDYAGLAPPIGFVRTSGVPATGTMTLHSGDVSVKMGSDRSSQCEAISGIAGDPSLVTATFSAGGCIDLQGVNKDGTTFQNSTSWDKLLDRDFISGGGGSCGGGGTGGSGVPTTDATPSPVQCPVGNDIVTIADAYIRGGMDADGDYQNTPYGAQNNLQIKSVSDPAFSRKIYLVFDLASAPASFTTASLVLTLQRHVEHPTDPSSSGPQPVDVYGIIDNHDWKLETIAEDAITWENAPRNFKTLPNRFEDSPGVPLLIPGYDFDLGGDGAIDPPDVTKYALDITGYVTDSLVNDTDRKISILMAIPTGTPVEGSAFKSRNIPDGEMCDRPFLHFE
jgi:hypothetical protein